jgi:hypothetical protein
MIDEQVIVGLYRDDMLFNARAIVGILNVFHHPEDRIKKLQYIQQYAQVIINEAKDLEKQLGE